ncbi:hypothetical protein [Zooshikella sp. RANM57]|uniref:hypothetical protein n=1 Tax=Zooshikella sp. RANM57 TaxID=3425863 RepID=UPI003D6E6E59
MFSNSAIAEKKLEEIPKLFHGTWDTSNEACIQPFSDMRMEIEARVVRYWESQGQVTRVNVENERKLNITFSISGEGESWESFKQFELNTANNTLTINTLEGQQLSKRVRCK